MAVLGRWKEQPGQLLKWGFVIGLILLAGLGGGFYWWKEWSPVATRRALVERVEEIGGAVTYQYQYDDQDQLSPSFPPQRPPEPGLIRGFLFGEDSALRIHAVRFPNGEKVDRRGLELLQEVGEVRQLWLRGTLADDETLREVAKLKSLRVLVLNSSKVTDEGLKTLRQMPNLREVAPLSLPITDEGLGYLESIPNLTLVDVSETWVTQERVNSFQEARPSVKLVWSNPRDEAHRKAIVSLERAGFFVSRNQEPEKKYPTYDIMIPLAPSFLVPSPLFSVRWRGSAEDFQVLPDIPNIRKLDISFFFPANNKFTEEVLPLVIQIDSLKELKLTATPITDEGLKKLVALPRLESLNLSQTEIGDAGMSHIAKIKTLSELKLLKTQVGNDGVAALKALPNLKVLDLAFTPITEGAIEDLAAIESLKKLRVGGNEFSDEAYERLRKKLPNCEIE